MPQATLTQSFIDKATAVPDSERTIYWDKNRPGFGLMVTSRGHKSYVVQYRAKGVSRRMTINGGVSLKDATKQAQALQGEVAREHDPLEDRRMARAAQANSLRSVAEEYFKREGPKLRSCKERRRVFERYIYPRFGARPIDSIKRSEIVRLLERVAEENGPVAAEHTYVALSRLFNWHALREDSFITPIVRGLGRVIQKNGPRTRSLSDDELRAVWRAAEGRPGTAYGHLVRFILLTATRLREAADMNRSELSPDGSEWLIPAVRYKTKLDHLVPLSKLAQAVLAEVPVIGSKGWVFTTNGDVPISGFSKFKKAFDGLVLMELRKEDPEAKPLPSWTTHDLRRTARTLMARAGVSPDHAERALGHVIGGVQGVYDRYAYKEEKRAAFEALASQIERILHPQKNIVPLRQRAAATS
jgi:integrase